MRVNPRIAASDNQNQTKKYEVECKRMYRKMKKLFIEVFGEGMADLRAFVDQEVEYLCTLVFGV